MYQQYSVPIVFTRIMPYYFLKKVFYYHIFMVKDCLSAHLHFIYFFDIITWKQKWLIRRKRPKMSQRPYLLAFCKARKFHLKFLSLKISLIQADCHWKQVLVVRSTIFHSLKQNLEILSERDSNLLASLDKGIVHRRSQCTLNTAEEQ